ncbi:actin-like ATPase domain-containing protein [Flammula alnicola]|nr:actin-like ATPase domain-containing protein [Flammula alnicola]
MSLFLVQSGSTQHNDKLTVSIDFAKILQAYGSPTLTNGEVKLILKWPGSPINSYRKIPTCLLYDQNWRLLAWGLEAKNAFPLPGFNLVEWFTLLLDPKVLQDGPSRDPRLPILPPEKRPIDLFTDFLNCIWSYAREEIIKDLGAPGAVESAEVWLMVPSTWDANGIEAMRTAGINAGLVQSYVADDRNWRERLRIMTEAQAASVHCARLVSSDTNILRFGHNFMVCDIGGVTMDISIQKSIGGLSALDIAEVSAQRTIWHGGFSLGLRFKELIEVNKADRPYNVVSIEDSFNTTDKLTFSGKNDDAEFFHFPCFNVEDPDDETVGLINGYLSIPGILLRLEVFDPVINETMELLINQVNKFLGSGEPLDAIFLVGGFSGNPYLLQEIQDRCKVKVYRPLNSDRGAATYGMLRQPLISNVVVPHSYVMKVKAPAEPEDYFRRPGYITTNAAGIPTCEKRVQYLIKKGAIVRKGKRIRTKFSKFSKTAKDSLFTAVVYTTDSLSTLRYMDEGDLTQTCRWTVDLKTLPSFVYNGRSGQSEGFYTEFEVGLELESTEVRGVLLYEGLEHGR